MYSPSARGCRNVFSLDLNIGTAGDKKVHEKRESPEKLFFFLMDLDGSKPVRKYSCLCVWKKRKIIKS